MELAIPTGTAKTNSSIPTAKMSGRRARIRRIKRVVPKVSEHHSHISSIFSMGSESDGAAEGTVGDGFFVAVVTNGGEIRFGAVQDGIEVPFAGDVFDLAAAEIVAGSQLKSLFFGEFRDDGAPDGGAYLGAGLVEADLEKEAAVEGRIEVGGKVGGGDEDATEAFKFLQEDVLEAIFHFLGRVADILEALAEEGVGLVEQEDGRKFVLFVCLPVIAE